MHDIGRLVDASRVSQRVEPAAAVAAVYPGLCRVILIGEQDPVYSPKVPREVGLFRFNPDGSQITIELTGQNLQGDLVLTIGEAVVRIGCAANSQQLREALIAAGISAADCRATVFPALWEFDFNGGRFRQAPPFFSAEPWERPEGDTETPVFGGGLTVVQEAWISETRDQRTPYTVSCRDWIPHAQGALKTGAIGLVAWSHEAGWLSVAWQCRDFSFATFGT